MVDLSDLRNCLTPNNRSGVESGHLGGDRDLDLDAALIVNFLKLLQSPTDHVVSVGLTVVTLHAGKGSCGTEAIDNRVGDKVTRVNRPTVVRIEADLFWRWFVHDGSLSQVGGSAELADRHRSVRILGGRRIRWGRQVESVVVCVPYFARAAGQDDDS